MFESTGLRPFISGRSSFAGGKYDRSGGRDAKPSTSFFGCWAVVIGLVAVLPWVLDLSLVVTYSFLVVYWTEAVILLESKP